MFDSTSSGKFLRFTFATCFTLEQKWKYSLFFNFRDLLLHFSISWCLFLGSDSYLDCSSSQTSSHKDRSALRLGAGHNCHGCK